MRIYTPSGDLAFKTFTFPDGQPHFHLETYENEFRSAVVETAIRNPSDLLLVMLVSDVLRRHGYSDIRLDVRYLLAARMDRAIDTCQPFSLDVVGRMINSCGFSKVRILDVHSDVALRVIRNSENILPYKAVDQAWRATGTPITVCPDKGAVDRVNKLGPGYSKIYCTKTRDVQTGALSGFAVDIPFPADAFSPFNALIVDDICDGGGTFVGLAKELRKVGAQKVYLYVTHGVFSKGVPLEGIDTIYTTDSYRSDTYGFNRVVCIPVSMKEM